MSEDAIDPRAAMGEPSPAFDRVHRAVLRASAAGG